MPKCALPEHLRERLHNDWIFPFSKIPRGYNAFGPRCLRDVCDCSGEGYLPWPPKLIEGYGVSRWESDGAASIIQIPYFQTRYVKGDEIYGREWVAVECAEGHPNFGRYITVKLEWNEGMNVPGQYHPSALQKFSDKGWMRTDPYYYAWWKVLKRREPEKDDIVMFHRRGYRMDSLDIYYNKSVGFLGLSWE